MSVREEEVDELVGWLVEAELVVSEENQEDSLAACKLRKALLRERNVCLTDEMVYSHLTPRSLAEWIVDNADDIYVPLVRLTKERDNVAEADRALVICVHALSGYARTFRRLARALEPFADVWGIQARGLNPGETPFSSNDSLLDCYLSAVTSLAGTRPINLLGFSSGGAVAHAMGVALEQLGHTVGPIFVLDTLLYTELPQTPSFDSFLTMMYSGMNPKAPQSELASFEAMDVIERTAFFFGGLVEEANPDSFVTAMPVSAIRRAGRVSYQLHVLLRDFRPGVFPGKVVLIRSRDSVHWGGAFVPWEPPCSTLVVDRIACLHIRMLTRPLALQKLVEIVRKHSLSNEHKNLVQI